MALCIPGQLFRQSVFAQTVFGSHGLCWCGPWPIPNRFEALPTAPRNKITNMCIWLNLLYVCRALKPQRARARTTHQFEISINQLHRGSSILQINTPCHAGPTKKNVARVILRRQKRTGSKLSAPDAAQDAISSWWPPPDPPLPVGFWPPKISMNDMSMKCQFREAGSQQEVGGLGRRSPPARNGIFSCAQGT